MPPARATPPPRCTSPTSRTPTSLAQRRDIARSAQDGDLPLPPLTDVSGQASLRRDVFLAPQR
ncbi:MAG: hypothetical protein ACHQ49_07205 [Elusimicrobiota bacterium]